MLLLLTERYIFVRRMLLGKCAGKNSGSQFEHDCIESRSTFVCLAIWVLF